MASRESVTEAQLLGQKIRLARRTAGLSANDLAILLRVTEQTVYRWEQGRHTPRLQRLHEIARRTQTGISELLPESSAA